MATFITMANYTQKGIENIKESPKRLDAVKKLLQENGGTLKDFYLVTGRYDIVFICEVPNDSVAAKLALSLGSQGNVRTETLRAFTEREYREIIGNM